jgi:hypothetical protein
MVENKLVIEDFWGEKLTNVEIIHSEDIDFTRIKEIKKISLGFGSKSITITPISDTDEVKVELINKPTLGNNLEEANIFTCYIGKKLGIIWESTNIRGYFDMYIIGFEYLHPNILILCEGSALLLFEANPFNLASSPKP